MRIELIKISAAKAINLLIHRIANENKKKKLGRTVIYHRFTWHILTKKPPP